ncbi:SCP-like protein [Ancylostoma duodenale]|uniref:SCP-like protein n=1 Tax=Ancylostoma duodenale TaxID=51022 RepID=A0A0C2DMQ4_9BILA|nr:SCP-like protein [Ancylostoma duodenale]
MDKFNHSRLILQIETCSPNTSNETFKSWSCELESKARQKIQFCPRTVRGLGSTGVNFWWSYGGGYDQPQQFIHYALNEWWKNAQQYRLDPDNRIPRHGQLNNVANIINGETTQLGCTYNVCGNTMVAIMCLYDEVGPRFDRALYDIGRPCRMSEECKTYRRSTCDAATGLCMKPQEPRDNGESIICPPYVIRTDKIRRTILDLHNHIRSLVARGIAEDKLVNNGAGFAPKAANMRKMEYDCFLEHTASGYARLCEYKHSPPEWRRNLGESLYFTTLYDADESKAGEWATRWWFAELKEFGVGTNFLTSDMWNRRGKQIGHYTQMVWGETDKIGCVIQHCYGDRGDRKKQTLVVCHYSKDGNIMDHLIYEAGEPCTKCPHGYRCTEDKLCARR